MTGVPALGVSDEHGPRLPDLQKGVSKEIGGAHLAWLCHVGQKVFMLQKPIKIKQRPGSGSDMVNQNYRAPREPLWPHLTKLTTGRCPRCWAGQEPCHEPLSQ